MEYTQKTPSELSKYVDEFHNSVKRNFEVTLTNIYNDEISKYNELIEHIKHLPFVQTIIDENNKYKEELQKLRNMIDNKEDDNNDNKEYNRVTLEISDKEITQEYQDMDKIDLNPSDCDNNHSMKNESSENESSENESSENESSDEDNVQISPTFPNVSTTQNTSTTNMDDDNQSDKDIKKINILVKEPEKRG